jgi:hypothetical protein
MGRATIRAATERTPDACVFVRCARAAWAWLGQQDFRAWIYGAVVGATVGAVGGIGLWDWQWWVGCIVLDVAHAYRRR